ncbi:hypothetical protein [Encephalitozoon cuniculi GB-M1]|uniref:Uncharacterized protein n=2 Tax=Encephalitozoon cuniculi TaxID=6035 RepID=Q8STY3_ENCCU|nr:uncharacterized protein ECU09_0080 [Encephalitozoon cuniculi GB-M1]AGE96246.1 hypothetical protein ECU09_0080 [Encephalitozoon cuniculi]KMV65487.1 hypothetical protein M970_090080 [Encephalitozoon cuniculi EcunIII-L]UYI26685.1 hypothetical protein J0A71_03g05210 [Encephalitozoon cuniculi]CAD26979.1 hypothetical protein [Encephalitozoon cuniculi GB-M1]
MNKDLITKTIPFLTKKSALAFYYITGDTKYLVHVVSRYRSRMNIISIEKAAVLLQKIIEMGRNDLVIECLSHVSSGRMNRILFKLARSIEPEKTQSVISELKRSHPYLSRDSSTRCGVVVSYLQNVAKSAKLYAHHCK